jgi:hypothetical protein
MGFDDLFDNKKKYIKYNHNLHRYEDSYSYKMPGRGNYALFILERIWNNRKLRFMLILTLLSLLTILIIALILIIPLIGGILDTVAKTGLKGVLEEITGLISGIWNGTGK